MSAATSFDVLSKALAVAEHPEARMQAVGPAASDKRSLIGLMNGKVKALIFVAVAIPAGLAMKAGLGSFLAPSAPEAQQPTNAQPERQGAASERALAAANRSAAIGLAIKQGAAPATKGASAAASKASPSTASRALAAPAAAAAMISQAPPPGVLERALPNAGEGMNSYDIARALAKVDPFAALAAAVEDLKPRPYYDPGGLNVGFGYCITKRKAEYGEARIRADLAGSGFEPRQVEALLKDRKAEVSKIKVSPLQAVRLLQVTKPDYEMIASGAVGDKAFAALPEHKRAALTHLAYNTGNVAQFTSLVKAVRKGDTRNAILNMNVSWRDAGGVSHTNTRLQAWDGAMLEGVPTFLRALRDPVAFEGHMANPDGVQALAHLAESNQRLAASPPEMAAALLRITQKRFANNKWAAQASHEESQRRLSGKSAPS